MKTKTISYIHTPPRSFCDQWENNIAKLRAKLSAYFPKFAVDFWVKILGFFRRFVLQEFSQSLRATDYIITNSVNIQNRTQKFLEIRANQVIYPAVHTAKFHFIGQKNYYHSHCRLESLKRIELIVAAFAGLPNQNLVITSSGPLENWLKNEIKTKNLTNIDFRGRVSDEELVEIMGNCTAGIMIPVDEDAGITQIEFLAAGKPVIAVAEGGLLETICEENLKNPQTKSVKNLEIAESLKKFVTNSQAIDFEIQNANQKNIIKDLETLEPKKENAENWQTGILIPSSPSLEDLIIGITQMTPQLALSLRSNCEKSAQKYDQKNFFEKLDQVVQSLLTK